MTDLVPAAPNSFGEAMRIGEVLAESGFFKDTKGAAQAVAKMLAGREMGFGPVASLTGIHLIEGKVTVGANLMAAAIDRSARHAYRVTTLTDTECRIEFYTNNEPAGVSTFSMADATRIGLANRDNWRKYPRNMLFARAMSNGAKWYCAGVFGGPIYTPEELGADVDSDGEVIGPVRASDAPGLTPGPVSSPPGPAPTLDQAIAAGQIEGLEPPVAPAPAQSDQPPAQAAAGPQEAPQGPQTASPAALAREQGIPDSGQRLVLLTVGGLDDASDLEAAYRALPAEKRDAVAEALAALRKPR